MYTPHVGRWLSADPAGYVDGSNRYLYVTNRPINLTDASGLQTDDDDAMNSDGRGACGCKCTSGMQKHHWFSQIGEDGQVRVNKICNGQVRINIHDFVTPMMDSCENTPHWWMNHGTGFAQNEKIDKLLKMTDCCLFLTAVIEMINDAYDKLTVALNGLNKKRADDGCPESPMPDCVMQKRGDKTGKDTKGILAEEAAKACKGITFTDIQTKNASLYKQITDRRRLGIQSGCVGLSGPYDQ